MLVPRRCVNCNNRATKFLGMIVLHPDTIAELDRIEGYYCSDCYARRMYTYALGLGGQYVKQETPALECEYCGDSNFTDYGHLQIHKDIHHSNEREAGTTVLDPAGKAQEVLAEDSKRWASEYVTPPIDTPISKAEELKKKFQKPKEGLHHKEMDVLHALKGEKIFGLPHSVSSINASLGYGEDFIRRAIEWLAYKNLITKEEHEQLTHPKTFKEQIKEIGFKCEECPAAFSSKHGLANHRRAHERRKRGRPKKQ